LTTEEVNMAHDIRSRVIDHNAEWVRSESTDEDRKALMEALLDGTPTRTVVVSTPRRGHEYRVTITEGIYHGEGFWEAEDPRTRTLRPRDRRENMAETAGRLFGRNLPEGWELRVIRHH
jgi:hypothetical protein